MVPISKSIWQLILFVYLNLYFMSIVRFNLFYCFSKIFFRERSKASPPNFAPPFCALCLIVCDFLPKTWNLGRKKRNPPPLVKTQCRAARRLPDIALIINNSSAATTTTAACGGNREELLGQRPARRACHPRHDADAGCRNPIAEHILNRPTSRQGRLFKSLL